MAMKRPKYIGYQCKAYPEIRTVINKVTEIRYLKIHSFERIIFLLIRMVEKLFHVTLVKNKSCLMFSHHSILPFTGIIHFCNTVNLSSDKWISTFETVIPRYIPLESLRPYFSRSYPTSRQATKALHAIAKNNCLSIIALSDCARLLQTKLIEGYPDLDENIRREILSKLIVLHPPQEIYAENIAEKDYNNLTFIFVGNDFFRKGGKEILHTFEKVTKDSNYFRDNISLTLIIISRMLTGDWVTHCTAKDKQEAVDFMQNNNQWVRFYNGLPNEEVIELIKTADIGLLPTMADTYGYSVLEMQACGVPVISTNVRALPEINNNDCGWIITVDKDDGGEAYYGNEDEVKRLRENIEKQLYDILVEIISNRNKKEYIKRKRELSLNRIKRQHSPESYRKELKKIMGLQAVHGS
jgi:glycosyltransferase involved in cell wall biosynthesis